MLNADSTATPHVAEASNSSSMNRRHWGAQDAHQAMVLIAADGQVAGLSGKMSVERRKWHDTEEVGG